MKQQEVNFHCYNCSEEIGFFQDKCHICNWEPDWDKVSQSYADKYLEIFEVYV